MQAIKSGSALNNTTYLAIHFTDKNGDQKYAHHSSANWNPTFPIKFATERIGFYRFNFKYWILNSQIGQCHHTYNELIETQYSTFER